MREKVTGACAVCGQRVSRYWGIGATYVPHGETGEDVLSDITVAGFCRTHKDQVIEVARADTAAKGTIQTFMDPFELREHQVRDFFAMAASIGPGSPPDSPIFSQRLPLKERENN
ncbi:hypothetical protein [Aeromicrobium ginsengisoli]|uniref:Uncharacterized protein n=1 Tax=Aeromicrobium ginsengisoli TaxID=363867 RepID=A0A5M4FF45_9ACTN|nr:hypothetical protein [Aeromicrobium ginsengisoli]KAA1397848.1 hypothetical protein ESP70_010925 [Aeromicrobium ginsengisoli]